MSEERYENIIAGLERQVANLESRNSILERKNENLEAIITKMEKANG